MFKKILLIFLLSGAFVYALEEHSIKNVMSSKVGKVLNILKNKSLSQKQKEQRSIRVMDDVFDYSTMAKISLSTRWKTLTTSQKSQFTKAFEKKLKHSYIDKLRLYNNQKVNIKDIKKAKSNRITFETQVIGLDGTYKVIYMFYKEKHNNQWYIYDVNLVGVSIIQTYRKQFSAFLKTKSFSQLLRSL